MVPMTHQGPGSVVDNSRERDRLGGSATQHQHQHTHTRENPNMMVQFDFLKTWLKAFISLG